MEKKLFDILKERGYVKDLTHEKEIIDLINGEPFVFYLGIDPTADSLHIGHFFALTLFRWLQDFGHKGIILVGGATALVGDPTGKSDMRTMLTKEQVEHNKKEVKELVKRFVKTDGDNPAIIVDNADWICDKTYVDFMRDIGVHFNVNTMLNAECYKKRLAFEVTKLVHGIEEANNAKITAEELFSRNGISSDMPNITLNKNKLGINILDLLVETNLTNSKSEARRLIEQKGISINQEKVESLDKTIEEKDLNNNFIIIQKGKKVFLKIIFDKNA